VKTEARSQRSEVKGQKAAAVVPMTSPGAKKGQKLTRYGSASGLPGQIVTFANRWRENYNPFRAFAIRKAVELIEAGQRGDYALLQWTYRRLERAYPTLSGLISRCEAPLLNFKWDIKIKGILPKGFTDAEAEAQQQTLRSAYGAVDNLTDAIRHLHMAEFREYSHLQKHRSGDGEVYHLEPLDQWMICRDGIYGDWFWNPDSRFTSQPAITCGESNRIGGDALPLEDFIIRAIPRPINEIALVIFARWALVAKNWDAFIEIYGVPGGVIEMPQNVPPDKEAQYEQSAKLVAEGGVGAIPNGSKYFPNDGPRGTDPFTPRIKTLDEDLVLAGTGGKMGMLNASTGLGGGNQSKTHDEVFQEIAQSRAAAISETFQRQFDAEVLEREHPGEPALVYFDLSPSEDVDVDGLVKNVVSLAGAGWKADEGWLKEQTGYELEEKEEPVDAGGTPTKKEIGGRKSETGKKEAAIANRLQELSTAGDEEFAAEFAAFNRDFPQVGRILNGNSNHDERGKFSSADMGGGGGGDAKARAAVGKTGTWKTLGLQPAAQIPPDEAAPEMEVPDARKKLSEDYEVPTPLGDKAIFGPGVLKHWADKKKTEADIANRLRFLAAAEDAISKPHEIWENERTGTRTFIHITKDATKSRVLHAWELKDGKLESFISISDIRRRGDKHREGRLLYAR